MADVVVGAQLKLDTGNTAPSVKEVRDNIKQLKTEIDGAKVGSDQHRDALIRLKAANEQLNPSIKEQSSTFSQLKDHISSTVPAFKGASEGASGFGTMLKGLMANPIVLLIAAIVAGLKFLYDSFKNSFEGGQKLEQVFAGLKAVMQVVMDRVFALGGAIIKFFSGDFKGALSDAKKAVSGVGDEIERVYNRTAELTKRLQAIKKEEREDDLDKAEREKRLALLREQLNDETVPIAKRKAIALELRKDQEKNAIDDLERSKRKAAIQIELLTQQKDGEKKNADEINEIRIGVLKTETENALEGVRTNKVIRNLDRQERQEEAAQEKAAKEKKKLADEKADEAKLKAKENQKAYNEKLLKLEHENELLEIKDANAKKLKEIEFAAQDERKAIQDDFELKKITGKQRTELLAQIERQSLLKVAEVRAEAAKAAKEQGDKDVAAAAKKLIDDNKKEHELLLKEAALKSSTYKKDRSALRDELDLKQKLIEEQYQKEIQAANLTALQKREIEYNHNRDMFDITEARKAISKGEKESREKDAEAIGGALNAISDLIGKQTVVGKGLAIASAIINTYTGATKALAQGGIAGIAGAIAVIATGLASVKTIISTKIPGQTSGSTPSTSSLSTAAPLQPSATATSTSLDQQTINGIGNAAGNRVFVLESDVRNSSERITRLNRAARLG